MFFSVANKKRPVSKTRKKWACFRNAATTKWSKMKHPPTGGGPTKPLTKLEQDVIDWLEEVGSFKISGIRGGMDTSVRINCQAM